MSVPAETAFSWVKQIPGNLFALDEKPLLGFPPPFPWKEFAAILAKTFGVNALSFQPETWQWRSQAELFSGLGEEIKGWRLAIAPLSGAAWWGMPQQEIQQLMQFLLVKEHTAASQQNEVASFNNIDRTFVQAFYRFIGLEAANAFSSLDFDKKLQPTFSQEEALPSESCLCLELPFSIENQQFHSRLFLSNEFRKSWAQRYLEPKSAADRQFHLETLLDVPIHLQIGKTTISQFEWKKISIGDFLILPSCSFDPQENNKENQGHVLLVINGIPYFTGEVTKGNIKIVEHPLHYEVDTPMDKSSDNKNDSDGDEVEFIEDDESRSPKEDEEEEFDIGDEDLLDVEDVPAPVPAPEAKKEAPAPKKEEEKPQTSSKQASIEEIPLTVVVEVGRIQMSVQKLLELQPGNMLELNIHPEAGVDLVVNGKRIAKGEILRIGDVLGVRILHFS